MGHTVVMGVAPDEKFYVYCSVLDGDDRGWRSEINDIPCHLVPSLFTFFTDILDNNPTVSFFQLHREL